MPGTASSWASVKWIGMVCYWTQKVDVLYVCDVRDPYTKIWPILTRLILGYVREACALKPAFEARRTRSQENEVSPLVWNLAGWDIAIM